MSSLYFGRVELVLQVCRRNNIDTLAGDVVADVYNTNFRVFGYYAIQGDFATYPL